MPRDNVNNQEAAAAKAVNRRNPAVNHLVVNMGNAVNAVAAADVRGQEHLTPLMLATLEPQEQKQILGERLYTLVREYQPSLCGKISGMLLEMDNSDLLHMLEDPESLENKMEEALAVLQAHQAKRNAVGSTFSF